MNREMNEETAIKLLKEYVEGDLYILLSSVNANMIGGFSFPYIGQMENGKILFLFTDLEYAKKYCVENGYEVLDGLYPLAKVEKENIPSNLEMIAKIASQLGVTNIDFNPGHESMAFGVLIPWMQKVLDYDLKDISIILSDQEMQRLKENNDGKVPLRFNPMQILGFKNIYFISPERRAQIDELPVKSGDTIKDFVDIIKTMPLNELILLSEVINRKYVDQARKEGRAEDEHKFRAMYAVLDQVIIHILCNLRIFTLLDNGETLIKQNRASYILYTDRFKYMGEYRYKEIELKEFIDELEQKGVTSLIVTAGPGEMHLSTVASFREFIVTNNK